MISLIMLDTAWRAWFEFTRESFSRSSLEISVLCTSDLKFSRFRCSTWHHSNKCGFSLYVPASAKKAEPLLFLWLCRHAASRSRHVLNSPCNQTVFQGQRSGFVLHPPHCYIITRNLPVHRPRQRLRNVLLIHATRPRHESVQHNLQVRPTALKVLGNNPVRITQF